MSTQHIAVDLGASSGRAALVMCSDTNVEIIDTERFPIPSTNAEGWRWDLPLICSNIVQAVRTLVSRHPDPPQSIAVDTWGVDYGLIGTDGQLLDAPFCYRDPRTEDLVDKIDQLQAYGVTGIPGQQINTSTQLLADQRDGRSWDAGTSLLLLPDLINHFLTGVTSTEPTIASTTQLLDVRRDAWATELITQTGSDPDVFPNVRWRSEVVGLLTPEVTEGIGLATPLPVISVGSHDTASAVAATPLLTDDAAYISCGTWACIGIELGRPVLTEAAREALFANERGIDGTITFHRSSMGWWLLQECMRQWPGTTAPELLAAAEGEPSRRSVVDPNAPSLFGRGDMPELIRDLCRDSDQPVPESRVRIVRCIVDSLAASFAAILDTAETLADRPVHRVHLVGGGARSAELCRAVADLTGLPVIAGPVEATVLGNALVQARHFGGPADLRSLRTLVADTHTLVPHLPINHPYSKGTPTHDITV